LFEGPSLTLVRIQYYMGARVLDHHKGRAQAMRSNLRSLLAVPQELVDIIDSAFQGDYT
jgi:hypothetical protein